MDVSAAITGGPSSMLKYMHSRFSSGTAMDLSDYIRHWIISIVMLLYAPSEVDKTIYCAPRHHVNRIGLSSRLDNLTVFNLVHRVMERHHDGSVFLFCTIFCNLSIKMNI